MTYIPKSVTKPRGKGSPGAAAPKKPNVTVVRVSDVLSFPERDGKKVLMLGSFVMKPNAPMFQIYMTPSTIDAPYETEGDEDAEQIKQTFKGDSPGDELELNEFIQNILGEDILIISGSCVDDFKKVYGTPCAPMKLKVTGQDNKDGRKKTLSFEQSVATSLLPGHYTGEIVLEDPFAAVGHDLTVGANTLMQKLPSSAVATDITVTTVTAEADSIVTLIGGGGAADATLEPAANVLLKGGANWTALEGAVIHFKVFEATTKMLIEVGRA